MKKETMEVTKKQWPEHGLERVPNCPVCGSSQRDLLHSNLTDQVFFCAPGKWSLYECQDCRCAFLDPRPSPDTIHLAYSKYYTHTSPNKEEIQKLSPLRRIRRSMANGYKNWRFGTDLKPSNRLGIPAAMIIPGLRDRLEQGFRNLPKPNAGARLLDVGFGSGAFLEAAQSMGWKVAGVDPDPVSVESAVKRGLDVRHGGIEAYADMPGCFDVVTMSHVIEHVHDPYDTLQTIYRLLKPGGFLWLSTPNIHSFGHEYYGRNWRGLEPPRHLILFNWYAIREILKKNGFTSIQKDKNNRHFASLAAKSEALSKGLDPYSFSKVSLRHRLTGILTGIRTRFQPHRTEFITLKAYKS
ncbi:MAG: methyltransferase domain-containing protein [Desulfobacteraceae bacterium]|nr:methyltransferase domain-containing protein [Desulfobacteraceae bacterium]